VFSRRSKFGFRYFGTKIMVARSSKTNLCLFVGGEQLNFGGAQNIYFRMGSKNERIVTRFSKPGIGDLETKGMFPRCSKPRFRHLGS